MIVTFHRSRPALWRGNGMGTEPAHYTIRHNGRDVGTLTPRAAYGWQGRIGDTRMVADKLAEAKAAIRDHLKSA